MRAITVFLLCFLSGMQRMAAQCEVITKVYGQVQTDLNRGYDMIATSDGHFVVAGEWNNQAYLLKLNAEGQQVALRFYGTAIGGTRSFFRSLAETPEGGIVAVGECENCGLPVDSLIKVVAIRTDASLNLDTGTGVKKFGGVTTSTGFTTVNQRFSPVVRRNGAGYILAATVSLGFSLNPDDVIVTGLSADLTPQWNKIHTTGYFEAPYDMVSTGDGFALTVNRAFVPNAVLLKINGNGDFVWSRQFAATAARGIAYSAQDHRLVVIGDRNPTGQNAEALVMRFDAATGAVKDSLLLGDNLGDEGHDIKVLADGRLMAALRTNRPNPFGIYATSRIYTLETAPLEVDCYALVPNPDNITNMGVSAVIPLSATGKDFAAAGIRGFYNRTFFHTRRDCEVNLHEATICAGETYPFNGQNLTQSGTYMASFTAVNGCDSVATLSLTVLPLPVYTDFMATICPGDTLVAHGVSLFSSGVYTFVTPGVSGCDSLVESYILTVLPPAESFVSASICAGESLLFNGMELDQTGVYSALLTAASGCDSTAVLSLTVISVETGVTQEGPQLSAQASAAAFQWIDCATGEAIPGANGPVFTAEETGQYAVVVTQDGCSAQSECFGVVLSAADEAGWTLPWLVRPNPVQEKATLQIDSPAEHDLTVAVFDAGGRRLYTAVLPRGSRSMDLDFSGLPAGLFTVTISADGLFSTKRLVKQ